MTLDEAIEHAKRVARTRDDDQCAADHAQLAEWLRLARGADEAARWYTAKIRELENRSKAFETLISEKEAENAKLRGIVCDLHKALFTLDIDHCQACPRDNINGPCTKFAVWGNDECSIEDDMRELGIEVTGK